MVIDVLTRLSKQNSCMGYLQIADAIEEKIRNGSFKANDRLPSTSELIDVFKVSRLTVQRSLERLSNRRLVTRAPKRGTFVSNGISSDAVGLVYGDDPMTLASPYYRLLMSGFHELSINHSVHLNNYIFMNEANAYRNFTALEEDIKAGKLKCLIIASATDMMIDWLERYCSIPWIIPNSGDVAKRIYRGVKKLCEADYKNIKVLSLYESHYTAEIGREREAMLKAYQDCDSIGNPPELIVCGQNEIDGYNYIKETFAKNKNLPDALLINHDVLTKGVLMATFELGIKIPANLGIVSHENKGAEILSPVKLASFVVDPKEVARKTFEFVDLNQLSKGKNICSYEIESTYIKGCSI